MMKLKNGQVIQNADAAQWSETEFTELRERSVKWSLWLFAVTAWGTSFRYWESIQLKDAGLFLSSLLSLLATWYIWKRKGLVAASWVCIAGTTLSLMVEAISFPQSWVWFCFALPVLQSGILIGSASVIWIGFAESLLMVLINIFFSAQVPLNPALFYLAGTTAMVWYSSRLISSSIYKIVYYAQNNKKALEEARDHQGRLARAIKSMDESNARLVKAYDNIALLQHEAEEARRQKVQFANMISHEMRAPLNFIIGATEMMVASPQTYGDCPWPPGLHEDIQRVFQSSQHLLNLINDVIALGQIEANRLILNFNVYSLNAVFNEIVTIMGASFENNRIYLDVQVEPDLPPLNLDRVRIRQVMLNLVSNALRHTKKGGVHIKARRDGGNILITVEDTGSGIPSDQLVNLFQEFYQAELNGELDDVQSSGLGLAISKEFIELHGGWIWAESPVQEPHDGEGPGTRFSFCLPTEGINQLHSLWIGHNDEYFRRRDRHTKKEQTILVYWEAGRILPSQLPISLSGYQIALCATEDQLSQAMVQYSPCGVIQVIEEGVEQRPWGALLPIPRLKCYIQTESVDLAELWDGYLTKPSTPDQVRNALKSIGVHFVTCLVIDDDPDISRFIELTFLSAGLNVDVRYAGTGAKGFELMQSFLPEVTFLDINLPDMSGWILLKKVRETLEISDLPVVIFSAVDNPNPVVVKLQSLELTTPNASNSYVMNDILQGIFDSLSSQGYPI